ncbi:MAG: hypothetical protein SO135_04190, partial [Sphaerochaetaceae bacterium]|nr:hypothetical protein [Sphaerochaetaceae bacterium]
MPWQSKYDSGVSAPKAPANYNPVGLYRKSFDVTEDMLSANGRVYISFQGVESSYYVYVNGKEVGYSEDSYSPHSFDITDYLTEDGKDNLLADATLRKLENISSGNDKVAAFIPSFLSMLESSNSFVRTRGLRLLVLNSNKDYGNLIEGHLSDLLNMLNDKSPIAVRQLLKSLPILAERRPDLKNQIIEALAKASFSQYRDSMAPLLEKDREIALDILGK